jgi:hypothetical protein
MRVSFQMKTRLDNGKQLTGINSVKSLIISQKDRFISLKMQEVCLILANYTGLKNKELLII